MILDTNAISGLFRGDLALERVLARADRHQLPVIVLGEYRFGLITSRVRRRLQSLLDQLVSESDVLDIDFETAGFYAEIRSGLRRRGTPIPENDVWIAALAIQHRQQLVSRDLHFDAVSGIQRLTW